MRFLKKKSKNEKLVGALLPRQFRRYLTLYCLKQRATKSEVIRTIIQRWYNSEKRKLKETDLIKEIQKTVQMTWRLSYKPQGISISDFIDTYRKFFIQKGVEEDDINEILSSLYNYEEREEDNKSKPTNESTE